MCCYVCIEERIINIRKYSERALVEKTRLQPLSNYFGLRVPQLPISETYYTLRMCMLGRKASFEDMRRKYWKANLVR